MYNLFNSNTPTTYETVCKTGDEWGAMDATDGRAAGAVRTHQRAV